MRTSTKKILSDALIFGFVGLIAGGTAGIVIASAYAVVSLGGKFNDVQGFEILDYAPWVVGRLQEPFETGGMIIGGAAFVCMIALIALAHRPKLDSHGSAQWATKDELKKASLAVRLKDMSGPIYAKLGSPKSRGEFIFRCLDGSSDRIQIDFRCSENRETRIQVFRPQIDKTFPSPGILQLAKNPILKLGNNMCVRQYDVLGRIPPGCSPGRLKG